MSIRKKTLRFIQIIFLFIGSMVIFFTYFNTSELFITKKDDENINYKINDKAMTKKSVNDYFLNVEYSGFDLSGNRYILKSKEAFSSKNNPMLVEMKDVTSYFYFKDDTVLTIKSDSGAYNNKTLDMSFSGNIKGLYEGSELYAENAEFKNSENYLEVFGDVRIKDFKGVVNADRLIFDIKKQKLNISSLNNNSINANINLK